MIKLPVKGHPPLRCLICKNKVGEPHDMAVLLAGALKTILRDGVMTDADHRGFILIGWHTHGDATREAIV